MANNRGSYFFSIEGNNAASWILLEPRGEEPARLKGWTIAFDLSGEITQDGAEEIATYLNDNLGDLIIYPPVSPFDETPSRRH